MAYAVVASRNNYSFGSVTSLGTSATLTPSSTDNWVLCFVKFLRSPEPGTVTVTNSSDSSTLTQAGADYNAGSGVGIRGFYQKCPNTSASTYTVSFGGTDTCQKLGIYVVEISGLDAAAYLDSKFHAPTTTPVGTGTDAITSGVTGTLASQPACVFGFVSADGQSADPASAAGTNFTGLTKIWSHFGIMQGLPEHRRVTATTAVAATATDATSGATELYAVGCIVMAEPPDSVSGTGALAAGSATIAGSGTSSSTGTGALAAGSATISGAGTVFTPGVLNVDHWLNFENGSDGQVVTDAILAGGAWTGENLGAYFTTDDPSAQTPGPIPNCTIEADAQKTLQGQIAVNGAAPVYDTGTRGMRCVMSTNGAIQMNFTIGEPGYQLAVGYMMRFNGPAVNDSPRDLVSLRSDPTGGYQFLQLTDSSTGNPNAHVHWQPGVGGVGDPVTITRGKWYWVTQKHVPGGEDTEVRVYDADSGALVGTSTGAVSSGTSGATVIQLGIINYGADGSQSVDYDNFVITKSNASFPLLPEWSTITGTGELVAGGATMTGEGDVSGEAGGDTHDLPRYVPQYETKPHKPDQNRVDIRKKLEKAYGLVVESPEPAVQERVAEVAKKYAKRTSSASSVPQLDYKRLAKDLAAVEFLINEYQRILALRDQAEDEEAMFMLMVMGNA